MKGTKLLKVAFLWSNEIYRPTNIVFSVATQRGAVSKDRGIFMTSQMAFAWKGKNEMLIELRKIYIFGKQKIPWSFVLWGRAICFFESGDYSGYWELKLKITFKTSNVYLEIK